MRLDTLRREGLGRKFPPLERSRASLVGSQLVSDEPLERVIREMPEAFTILDYAATFKRLYPRAWARLRDRYGLYGSGTRYSVFTYLSNRLSTYSRRKEENLLEPTPVGWKPEESRFLRRTTPEEREHFGSRWIVVFRRTGVRGPPA